MAAPRKTTAKTPAKPRASRSGNPATRAAAAQSAELTELEKAQQEAAQKAAQDKMRQEALERVTYRDDGVAVVPASRGKDPKHQFRFVIEGEEDGEVYTLPNLNYISVDQAMAMQNLTQAQAAELIFEQYLPGIMSKVDGEQLMGIVGAWREYSVNGGTKVGLGESSPS